MTDGSFLPADIVLANADLPYIYQELLPPGPALKRINRLGYTCSALVFHWGMDAVLPGLEQHNVFVSNDYRENISAVFDGNGIAPEPSFYVHSPARADRTAAPEGQDSVSVIVPVGHLKMVGLYDGKTVRRQTEYRNHEPGIANSPANCQLPTVNWNNVIEQARASVLARLAKEGIPDVEKHIKFEKVYNPEIWQNLFNLSRGATFGSLNHNLMQMGYFRPHNQHGKYRNLFFAGGSTHPGNGVPLTLISARLAAEKIIQQYGER
jgi:phytoene desaturase